MNTIEITNSRYELLRDMGIPPSQMRSKAQELWLAPNFGIKGLVEIVIGIITFCIIDKTLNSLLYIGDLWITSPSGQTTIALPLPIALRIIRKKGWEMSAVAPIRHPRKVSRWDAIKIVIGGDK